MTFQDLIAEIASGIFSNKLRSGLTALGIIIGVAAVIAMLSIGNGVQNSIEQQVMASGSNLLVVIPGSSSSSIGYQARGGAGSGTSLTLADSQAIQQGVQNISALAPEVQRSYQVTATGTNTNAPVIGTVASYAAIKNITMKSGSFVNDLDNNNDARVAVLGATASTNLFNNQNPLGQSIRINGIDFTVIGLANAQGGASFNSPDNDIYIPLSTMQQFLSGTGAMHGYLSMINVQASSQQVMDSVQQQITALLLQRHNISDPNNADFSVINQQSIMQIASTVTSTFTIFLASIAAISLLVGGIGIMNMMLTIVSERTREIGLRKAIGAKNNDISRQFLFESLGLTMLGGTIGIILGWLISFIIGKAISSISPQVTLQSVTLAFGVSVLIGVVFGYYPARQAAKLNPIDALRYE